MRGTERDDTDDLSQVGLKMHSEIVTRGHRNLMGEMTYIIVVQGRRS